VLERSTPEAIFRHPAHEYTKALLAAIPRGRQGGHPGAATPAPGG
jgi:ABC-type dipeptide/oligopeptide/nickel transport system ATPase component